MDQGIIMKPQSLLKSKFRKKNLWFIFLLITPWFALSYTHNIQTGYWRGVDCSFYVDEYGITIATGYPIHYSFLDEDGNSRGSWMTSPVFDHYGIYLGKAAILGADIQYIISFTSVRTANMIVIHGTDYIIKYENITPEMIVEKTPVVFYIVLIVVIGIELCVVMKFRQFRKTNICKEKSIKEKT
jgi:hypothetical protein